MSLPISEENQFAPIEGAGADDIEAFLVSVLEGGPIDNLALFRVTVGGEELVRRMPVGAISAPDLAENLHRIVSNVAGGLRGVTSFILQACKGTELRGTTVLKRQAANNGTTGPGTGLEEPNQHGFLAATMRHTEAAFRYGLSGGQDALAHWKAIAKEQAQRIRELEARELEVATFARNLIVQSVDQDYLRGKNAQNLALQKAAGDALVKAIPAVIKKITETKALDQTTAVLTKVQGFVQSLKAEQVGALVGILDPNQAEALRGLLQETNQVKEQSNDTSSQASPPA